MPRLGPLALAHNGHDGAIGLDTVDIDLVGADHPVDVNQAGIAALRFDLILAERRPVDEALGVALAERDMARGVFANSVL